MGLARIGDDEAVLLGQRIHAGTGGEILRALRAAVKHDDQAAAVPSVAEAGT